MLLSHNSYNSSFGNASAPESASYIGSNCFRGPEPQPLKSIKRFSPNSTPTSDPIVTEMEPTPDVQDVELQTRCGQIALQETDLDI